MLNNSNPDRYNIDFSKHKAEHIRAWHVLLPAALSFLCLFIASYIKSGAYLFFMFACFICLVITLKFIFLYFNSLLSQKRNLAAIGLILVFAGFPAFLVLRLKNTTDSYVVAETILMMIPGLISAVIAVRLFLNFLFAKIFKVRSRDSEVYIPRTGANSQSRIDHDDSI